MSPFNRTLCLKSAGLLLEANYGPFLIRMDKLGTTINEMLTVGSWLWHKAKDFAGKITAILFMISLQASPMIGLVLILPACILDVIHFSFGRRTCRKSRVEVWINVWIYA